MFKSIQFQNFGPIEEGIIEKNNIMIFFGPNNPGKSLAAKFIHSVLNNDDFTKHRMKLYSKFDL